MAYFKTFTATFVDIHNTMPATWRMDIYDDQANAGVVPYELQLGPDPLIIERIGTSDDKNDLIIGEQITVQYVIQDGLPDPLPTLFFDADERRFQVQLFKNGNLYGVYYVKPDGGRYPYKHAPYTVSITAVDGLAFLKGTIWNAYTPAGLLDYRWMTLYEILIERGLFLIMDSSMEVNLISSLKPANMISAGILNNLWIHSDMFIDFAKGPDDVYTVLQKVLNDIHCRLILSENKIWLIRIPDLMQSSITAENYIHGIYNPLLLQTAVRSIGPDESIYNAIPVKASAYNLIFPALKKVEDKINYKSINLAKNFQWSDFNGTDFTNWTRFIGMPVTRSGAGTADNPYKAVLQYAGEIGSLKWLLQDNSVIGDPSYKAKIGDIIQFQVPLIFHNTSMMSVKIVIESPITVIPLQRYSFDGSGAWHNELTGPTSPRALDISRSGNKQDMTYAVQSLPIPPVIEGVTLPLEEFNISIFLYTPYQVNAIDPPIEGQKIEIGPLKLGVVPFSIKGIEARSINQNRVSKVMAQTEHYFNDNGAATISNTIGVDNTGTPAKNWNTNISTTKNLLNRYTLDSLLDQYTHSIYGWEGTLKSNNIQFWNIFTLFNIIGKRLIAMKDRYNVRSCQHEIGFQEILPDGVAITTYLETDIDSNS